MTTQIDQLPYYDPLTKLDNGKMQEVWIAAFSALIETLNGYLTDFGIFIPQITTAERDSIQSPIEGQLIYNTDSIPGPPVTADLQVWQTKAGIAAWRTITTV
jgi:hypothetical protein